MTSTETGTIRNNAHNCLILASVTSSHTVTQLGGQASPAGAAAHAVPQGVAVGSLSGGRCGANRDAGAQGRVVGRMPPPAGFSSSTAALLAFVGVLHILNKEHLIN